MGASARYRKQNLSSGERASEGSKTSERLQHLSRPLCFEPLEMCVTAKSYLSPSLFYHTLTQEKITRRDVYEKRVLFVSPPLETLRVVFEAPQKLRHRQPSARRRFSKSRLGRKHTDLLSRVIFTRVSLGESVG